MSIWRGNGMRLIGEDEAFSSQQSTAGRYLVGQRLSDGRQISPRACSFERRLQRRRRRYCYPNVQPVRRPNRSRHISQSVRSSTRLRFFDARSMWLRQLCSLVGRIAVLALSLSLEDRQHSRHRGDEICRSVFMPAIWHRHRPDYVNGSEFKFLLSRLCSQQ